MLYCLHPIANDVEENPGPTIFHIIDPTSADSTFFFFFFFSFLNEKKLESVLKSATGCLAFLTFRLFRA